MVNYIVYLKNAPPPKKKYNPRMFSVFMLTSFLKLWSTYNKMRYDCIYINMAICDSSIGKR